MGGHQRQQLGIHEPAKGRPCSQARHSRRLVWSTLRFQTRLRTITVMVCCIINVWKKPYCNEQFNCLSTAPTNVYNNGWFQISINNLLFCPVKWIVKKHYTLHPDVNIYRMLFVKLYYNIYNFNQVIWLWYL